MARYGSAFDDETRTRKAEGIGTPVPPGTFPGDAANEPGPDNVIDHWFEPRRNFEPRPFPDKAPANDVPDAPLINLREPPLNPEPVPWDANLGQKFPEGFDPLDPMPAWNQELPSPGLLGATGAGAVVPVIGLAATAFAAAQQQYQNTYTPPPTSWESGVAGAEGSDPVSDPGTQGAETSPPDNSVTPGEFTDYGGQQLPGNDTGGGSAFDSGGGAAQDYSNGWFSADYFGRDYAGGGGGISDPEAGDVGTDPF